MKRSRTIINFSRFQEIELSVTNTLSSKHLSYGVYHSHGITSIMVDARLTREDFDPVAREYIQFLYYEDTYIAEEHYVRQDDPNDILDCMTHSLSGLID